MIVGKIIERSASTSSPAAPPRPPSATSSQAFPPALHRSQRPQPTSRFSSALPKAGESSKSASQASPKHRPYDELSEVEKIRQSVDEENSRRVAEMSQEEREEEARELKERFGPGLEDLMRRRRQRRLGVEHEPPGQSSRHTVAKTSPTSTDRDLGDGTDNEARVKAMSAEEREQEIAELEERFGSTVIDALRQRASRKSARYTGRSEADKPTAADDPPEVPIDDLKARYFPDLQSEPEKMAWMKSSLPTTSSDNTAPRFDLSGRQLSSADERALPTNVGLHHHGSSPDLAGYTIDEILHLCQSTVPSQRITMMGALAGLIRQYVSDQASPEAKQIVTDKGLCERGANMAVGAILLMSKSAGIFRAAVDLFYEALGGSRWIWMEHHDNVTPFAPTEQYLSLSGVTWEDVVPTFGEMLATDASSPRTTTQILRILRRLAVMSDEHCELVTPLLPEMVRSHVVLRPWPATDKSVPPSTEVLALMSDIIVSSRRCAAALVKQGIIEPLLKFPLTLTWDDSALGRELSSLALSIINSMARYGLATSIARSGAEPLDRLRGWLAETTGTTVAVKYLRLLRTWTVCATDPHKTTPEHDLTWAQVSAMGWTDDVLALIGQYVEAKRWRELEAALDYLAAWLEGCEINEVERGAEQKHTIREQLQKLDLVKTILLHSPSEESLNVSATTTVARQILRVHSIIGDLLSLPEVDLAVDRYRTSKDPVLRYWLSRCSIRPDDAARMSNLSFELVRELQPGAEPLALDRVDSILRADYRDRSSHMDSLPSDKLEILRPLLHYAVLPDLTNVIGPDIPLTDYLKATSTLRPSQIATTSAQRGPGLPLGNDWFFSPLNELLHSATSAALAQTPPDWDPKEIDLVRATLILASIGISTFTQVEDCLNRSELLFNLMKVFMLEHGQQTPTNHSETDLFRDPTISSLIAQLISLTTARPAPHSSSLEVACKSFLGSETPFFQWYTDFVALYEGISFGDHAFTQLLIPPLAMNYPVDFRRLFWGEHTAILRSIKLVDSDIPLEDPRGLDAFFEPVETDQGVFDGMIRAAGRGWLKPSTFLHQVAVHHLASNIWKEEEQPDQKRLLVGVLSTCPDAFVKEVFEHRIGHEVDLAKRRDQVQKMAGDRGIQRLAKLG